MYFLDMKNMYIKISFLLSSREFQKSYVIIQVNKNVQLKCGYSFMFTRFSGISENEAEQFLKNYKLENREIDFLIDSFETYRRLGLTTQDIVENGKLFNYFPREHEHHRWVMEEGGFSNFSPGIFIRLV